MGVDVPVSDPKFGYYLRELREREGVTRLAYSRRVGIDASYLTRIECGKREAPRLPLVVAMEQTLNWRSSLERERFYALAGYLPPSATGWDDTLSQVLGVLTHPDLSPVLVEHFRRAVAHLTVLTVQGATS